MKIADLLTEEEWEGVCEALGVKLARSAFKAAPEELFERVSKTSYAMAVLGKVELLLWMLRDVTSILQQYGVHARTTNSIVVLSDEFELTQQQFDLATKWSDQILASAHRNTWSELESELEESIVPALDDIRRRAEPRIDEEREDIVEAAIRIKTGRGPARQRRWTEADFSEEILEEYRDLVRMLGDAVPPELEHDPVGGRFAQRLNDVVGRHTAKHDRFVRDIRHAERRLHSSRRGIEDSEREPIRIFIEKLKFLADWERSDHFADLLQIDIFRHRPQLYELWILCRIIRTMATGGFGVALLEVTEDEQTGRRWELKYAKASRPVVRLSRGNEELFLFYQLFRRRDGGDMPDISLWENPTATGDAIWIIDPKHSEKGGYSVSDYQATAERYRRKFRPRLFSTIVEYFPRHDLSAPPSDVILDVRPGGTGISVLLRMLHEAHELGPVCVAVVDVSSSFEPKISEAISELSTRRATGVWSDQFITFADQAIVHTGLAGLLSNAGEMLRGIAGGDTRLAPLLTAMRSAQAIMGVDVRFVVVSDFNFADGSEDDLAASGFDVESVNLGD